MVFAESPTTDNFADPEFGSLSADTESPTSVGLTDQEALDDADPDIEPPAWATYEGDLDAFQDTDTGLAGLDTAAEDTPPSLQVVGVPQPASADLSDESDSNIDASIQAPRISLRDHTSLTEKPDDESLDDELNEAHQDEPGQ